MVSEPRSDSGDRPACRAGMWCSAIALAMACFCAPVQAAGEVPAAAGIGDPPAASVTVRHGLRPPQLQALAGQSWRGADLARGLKPVLVRLLGTRYDALNASMVDTKPWRAEGKAMVAEGIVPDTLGYRGGFLALGDSGDVLGVIKSGRHGTTVERYGSLALLKDPAVLHAYQEFLGIDE